MPRAILIICLLLAPRASILAQDCGEPPVPASHDPADWKQSCLSHGGTWVWDGDPTHRTCSFPADWCHKMTAANTPTGIDPVDLINQLPAPRNMKEVGQELTLAVGVAGMNAFLEGMKENAQRAAAAQAERERQAEIARQQALIRRRQIVRNLLNTIGGNSELQMVFDDSALGIKRAGGKPAAKGYGISGLPGVYTGGSQDGNHGQSSYGIQGLPGVYTQNGNETSSARSQSYGIQGLPGANLDGATAPAASQPQGYGMAALPAPAVMDSGATKAAPVDQAAQKEKGAADPLSSLALPDRDARQSPGSQQAATAATFTPAATPSQPASSVAAKDSPAMQQLQTAARTSASAVQASSAEEAADKAGMGFDRAAGAPPPPVRLSQSTSAAGITDNAPTRSSDPCAGTADGSVNLRCASTDVVDPQRVRLAAALVTMAGKTTDAADRAAMLEQALDTANGDAAITAQPNAALPEVAPSALAAFQQANAMYRRVTDLHVRVQERFNEAQRRRELAVQMLGPWYRQVAEIDKAQLQNLSGEKAHALLAEILAGVRKEDEAMHLAGERLVYADLNVERARIEAEHALAAMGSPGTVQPASLDDVKFLVPLVDPGAGKDMDALLTKWITDEYNFKGFITPSSESDVDLLFPPDAANLRYAQMDPFWKQHPKNVQRFMDDENFRQSARTYWQKVVDERDRQYQAVESQYARRLADYVREHGLPQTTDAQHAMAATMRAFAKDRNDQLRAASDKAADTWTSWLQQNEKSR